MPNDKNNLSNNLSNTANKLSVKSDEYKAKAFNAIDTAEDRAKDVLENAEWSAKGAVVQAADAGQRLSDKIVSLASRTKEQAKKIQETSSEKLEEVEDRIKQNPFKSTAIALGVGTLLGMLFTKSKR